MELFPIGKSSIHQVTVYLLIIALWTSPKLGAG
jgi:hypothetical protein